MKIKKILSLFTVSCLCLSMAACGNANSSSSGKKEKIVVWNAGIQTSDDSGTLTKDELPFNIAKKEFEKKNPNYEVVVVDYGMDDLQKAFTAANLSKSGPDIVAMWAGSATQSYKDHLVDFNTVLDDSEKKMYDTSSLLHANNDSKEPLIGLNTGMSSTFVMYYNKEIFEKNNLKVPTTFEEFEKVSEQLKKKNINPLLFGDKDGYTSTWMLSSLLANQLGPDNIAKLANGEEKMSGKTFKTELEKIKSYVGKGYTNPDYLTMSDGDAIQSFVQGDTAMIIHGNWAAREFSAMGDKVDVANIPVSDAKSPYANYIASQPNINLVVTKYSKVQDKAVEFAKYLATPEFNKKSQDAFYSEPTANRLATKVDGFTAKGKNVTGFDSLISGEASSEFYKLVPTYMSGKLGIDELTQKLDSLNKK